MRLSVIGLGYLGLVHALSLARAGSDVVGVDIDKLRVNDLIAGNLPCTSRVLMRCSVESSEDGS